MGWIKKIVGKKTNGGNSFKLRQRELATGENPTLGWKASSKINRNIDSYNKEPNNRKKIKKFTTSIKKGRIKLHKFFH